VVRALVDQIERRVLLGADILICKKVLEWMDGHQNSLPKEFRKPSTDAQRAEYRLRNKFKHLKRKPDHPPVVFALLDQIVRRTSEEPEAALCLDVLAWMYAHENALPMEWKVFVNNFQRAECMLARRWRSFKRRKTCSPHSAALLGRIQSLSLRSPLSMKRRSAFLTIGSRLPSPFLSYSAHR
jgi:hypothetical protein